MKYLNLSEGFNPYKASFTNKNLIHYDSFFFSGGEPHIKIITKYSEPQTVHITCRINSMNDLGILMVAYDALRESSWMGDVYLTIPYFPGARQDRRMIEGEPLTIRVYADIINEMRFGSVTVFDPHSDVTAAVLDRIEVVNNHKFVKRALRDICRIDAPTPDVINMWGKEVHIVSPDAGANKKISKLAIYLNAESIVKCDKTRDVSTGAISGFEVYTDDLEGRDAVIVDDICDGGGTFLGLAKELKKKNAGNLHLVVSHGIFSKGLKELLEVFSSIYTTDSIKDISEVDENKLMSNFNVIKLIDIL